MGYHPPPMAGGRPTATNQPCREKDIVGRRSQ
ncbi:hypothetical protein E2C01_067008 [Portunus trituberculatus]|uniref:Uncharacterized protein n=1 Tax=Portunus trituberculatus TaxID=210409 RepID=A0A5B7HTX2_PORTR|nr:hypothetical protein [Portunus trituberculatus]